MPFHNTEFSQTKPSRAGNTEIRSMAAQPYSAPLELARATGNPPPSTPAAFAVALLSSEGVGLAA